MTNKKYEVLFMGENEWTVDGKPLIFNSYLEAKKELFEYFADLVNADMDYDETDFTIEEVKND